MAIVVGPGGLGSWTEFRFKHLTLLGWCDGQERILEAGADYPADMPFDVLARRLKVMTSRQQGSARIWRDAQDQVHVIMTRDRRGRA